MVRRVVSSLGVQRGEEQGEFCTPGRQLERGMHSQHNYISLGSESSF